MPKPVCVHCGTKCDPEGDYCLGCKKIACVDCCFKHDHFGSGRHGGFPVGKAAEAKPKPSRRPSGGRP